MSDDPIDKLTETLTAKKQAIEKEARAAKRQKRQPRTDPEATGNDPSTDEPPEMADKRPTVLVTTNEFAVNEQAEQALAKSKRFYQRSGSLVRIIRTGGEIGKVNRGAGSPKIVTVKAGNLREEFTRVARFVRPAGDDETKPTHPPDWLVSAIMERGEWKGVPFLEAVVESPVFLADGVVLDEPGFNAESGLLLQPNSEFPPVPSEPSQSEARASAERILELVSDFPFSGSEHVAVWLAGLLTLLGRFAFAGPSPLFAFDATTPGSGKSRLVDLCSTIAFGRQAPRAALPQNDEETRKLITSLLLAGDRLLLLDNLTRPLGGPALDALLTSTTWKDRILGGNKTVELQARSVLFATGNNMMLRGDMLRRCLLCRLEPTEDNPDERTDFRIPDLLGHALQRRGEILRDALLILRGYHCAGRPTPRDRNGNPLPRLGSFEGWSDLIRGAVVWSTDRDPCGTRQELREEDSDSRQLESLLNGWAELEATRVEADKEGWTCAEVVRLLKESEEGFPVLRAVVAEWSTSTASVPTAAQLGYRLRRFRGRWVGGRCLDGVLNRAKVQVWRIRSR